MPSSCFQPLPNLEKKDLDAPQCVFKVKGRARSREDRTVEDCSIASDQSAPEDE